MKWSLAALLIGCLLDLLLGDPHQIPHPVVGIGKLISLLEKAVRSWFPATRRGERTAGFVLWIMTAGISAAVPAFLLWLLRMISPWLCLAVESVMCWQVLAARSLCKESMKVYGKVIAGDLPGARQAVSMIVGRDTDQLDEPGVIRAAVETVAENTSDGVIAPLLFLAIGGAPLGFFYKAANTMDSMLGYIDPPYTHLGWFPAKADDVLNFLPARISALLLLAAGGIHNGLSAAGFFRRLDIARFLERSEQRKVQNAGRNQKSNTEEPSGYRYAVKNGWHIFFRDRYKHASPNSAQTESACAGLLGVRLAGNASYHGVLHEKPFIGDSLRPIEAADIPRTCALMYGASFLALLLSLLIRAGVFWVI